MGISSILKYSYIVLYKQRRNTGTKNTGYKSCLNYYKMFTFFININYILYTGGFACNKLIIFLRNIQNFIYRLYKWYVRSPSFYKNTCGQ